MLIPDHHPGYISLGNLRGQHRPAARPTGGPRAGTAAAPPGKGAALLQGLLRCGRCGRIMQVGYSGSSGTAPRYVCGRANQLYGAHDLPARRRRPAARDGAGRAVRRCWRPPRWPPPPRPWPTPKPIPPEPGRVRTARWNGPASKPAGRCASTTTSSRRTGWSPGPWRPSWKTSSPPCGTPKTDLRRPAGPPPGHPHQRGTRLDHHAPAPTSRAIFHAPATTNAQRKQLIRAVDHRGHRHRADTPTSDTARTCQVQIIWQGGASTGLQMPMPASGRHSAPPARTPRPDPPPGLQLRRHHHRPDPRPAAPPHRDRPGLQENPRQGATARSPRHPRLPGTPRKCHTRRPGCDSWSASPKPDASPRRLHRHHLPVAARRLRHRRAAHPRRALADPHRPGSCATGSAPRPPTAGCPSARPPPALGVARQTVLNKVQRGELNAVHVTRGRRKGLRIQVEPDQAGLFDTP